MTNKILDFKSFQKQDLSIMFVGDIMCNDRESETILRGLDPFKHMSKFFNQFDLRVGNLETTFGGEISNFPRFSADDRFAKYLAKYFQIVFTANNHCHDFGDYGINRTIKILDQHGIYHLGTGQKKKSLDVTINGYDITFLNYTINVNGKEANNVLQGYDAEEDKKGLINFYTETKVKEEVDSAKKRSEIIIVGLHGGPEYDRTPKREQQEKVAEIIGAGVDILIGGHPHVFQGGVQKENKFGAYSLGNFFSDQDKLKDSDSGTVMCSRIDLFGNYTYSFLPVCTYFSELTGHKVLPLTLVEQGYYNFINNEDRKTLFDSLSKIRNTLLEQGLTEEPFPLHLAV